MCKDDFRTKVEEMTSKLLDVLNEEFSDGEKAIPIVFCALEIVVSNMFSMVKKEKLDLCLNEFCERVKLNIAEAEEPDMED